MTRENHMLRLVVPLFLMLATALYSQESNSTRTIGVIPFSPEGITEDEALIIAKAVREAIASHGSAVSSSEIMDAIEEVDCDDSPKWGFAECVVAVGRECDADYMIGGTRILSNCRGYDAEIAKRINFDPQAVVEI